VRRPLLLLILAVAALLVGCWDYTEVETLTFAMGAGLDPGPEGGSTLTVETLAVQGGDPTQLVPYVTTATGITMFTALRNMANITGKQVFFGHIQAMVFSEEFARSGVGEAVGFIQRDVGIRTNMWLFVAKGSSAEDVFKAEAPLGTSVGHYLGRVMRLEDRNPIFVPIQVWEFNRALSEEGVRPTMPVIELVEIGDTKVPRVAGSAVFKSDKLVGWLDDKDSRILHYLLKRQITGVIVTDLEFRGETKPIAAEVNTAKVEIIPKWEQEQLSISIDVKMGVDLHEIGHPVLDYSQKDLKRMLEEAFARQMKRDIEHFMHTIQQGLQADVVGFGNVVKKRIPSAWRQLGPEWEELFPHVPVSVRVAVLITETGTLAKPLTGRP